MKYLYLFFFTFTVYMAEAQDTIIKKDGDLIKAKITEIGTEEVKFKVYGEPDGPVITMKRSDIKTAKVAGQTIIDVQGVAATVSEDIIVKKSGDMLKVKVMEIGTEEVKFKLFNNPDGPMISMKKSEIKTMKVEGQTVIDVKTGLTEDIITKKDGTTVKAKISEMGADEVKYKLYSNPDGPVMSLKKSEIENIKIDGQVVYQFKEDPLSISNKAILDKTSALKFHFFSPLNHHIAFSYEWMGKPGMNWEVGLGLIGPGTSIFDGITRSDPKGLFLRGGPKFLLGNSSDIQVEGAKYAHPLKGKYFKIEGILNAVTVSYAVDTFATWPNQGSGTINYKNKYQSIVFNLIFGRQYIFGNTITVGWYLGVGYGFESKTSTAPLNHQSISDYDPRRYSHSYYGKNFPLTTTLGFNIGYILKTPEWLKTKSYYNTKPPTRHSMNE